MNESANKNDLAERLRTSIGPNFDNKQTMKPKEFVEEVLTQYFEMFKDEAK